MIQFYGGQPIAILRQYIKQMKNLGEPPVFENHLRENKSLFSDAPSYSVPVVLADENSQIHQDITGEIENIVNELEQKLKGKDRDEQK